MTALPNPYTSMLLTYAPDRVYGHDKEIASILQVISAPEPTSHAIYGLRTIGKTTLLKYLKDPAGALRQHEQALHPAYRPGGEQRLLFVYLDLHRFAEGDNLFDLMLRQLVRELAQETQYTDLSIPDLDLPLPRQQAVTALRKLLYQLDAQQARVVFLLDEFDEPLTVDDPQKSALITADDDRLLRVISDSAVLVIATEAPIVELRPDIAQSSPLLGILRPEVIGLLSEDAARRLITAPLESSSIVFSVGEQDFLLKLGGQQPFLLIATCELYFDLRQQFAEVAKMLDEAQTRGTLQTQMITRLCSLHHVDIVLSRMWNALRDDERMVLGQVATDKPVRPEQVNTAVQLAYRGLLVQQGIAPGAYRLPGTLLREYVRQAQQRLESQKRRSIKQDTDHLSPIDSALFGYLQDNANTILGFDQILDIVWEDREKSKRALEAAVQRLRRYIGASGEIRNIRGIGYKYIPGKDHETLPQ